MADLTIVTCLAPCLAGEPEIEAAVRLLQPLADAGIPLVVYVEESWKDALPSRCAADTTRLHETSAARRWATFGLKAELEAAWVAAAGPQRPSLDYFTTTLTKMGMLHDQSIWNPFGTRHLVWIDADVAASVHPGYFADERLLDRLPHLLQRFFILARPCPVTDAAGTADAARVQGQLFGGELGEIAQTNALYYQTLDQCLRQKTLPTQESLFTRMLQQHPERFDRFVLQDNGLLGFLFAEMRRGQVSIERTSVY